ncbi:uncharacterized protein [Triticum aestivum]|uniref:uncharacterized protein n=1 Tax=Triticum aestivum TaxID=4565 RepID=UPI001D00B45D|nr:uncharacterized protein LOC123038872 [Triticum aestivum]
MGVTNKRQIFSLEGASTEAMIQLLRITDNHGVLCVTIFFRNHQVLMIVTWSGLNTQDVDVFSYKTCYATLPPEAPTCPSDSGVFNDFTMLAAKAQSTEVVNVCSRWGGFARTFSSSVESQLEMRLSE